MKSVLSVPIDADVNINSEPYYRNGEYANGEVGNVEITEKALT